MIFIIDTNILFSALVKDSETRKILINPPFLLFAPENIITEIIKYEDLIIEKSGFTKTDFELLFEFLIENINIVEKEEYISNLENGNRIMGDIHKGDVPFIALALSIINDGIWSEDKHFEKQDKVKIWKTKDIINFINKS